MFVTYSSIPSDIAGGKASSFVAWIKRTGMSIVFLVSLRESADRICETRKWVEMGLGIAGLLQFILEIHLLIPVPAYCLTHQPLPSRTSKPSKREAPTSPTYPIPVILLSITLQHLLIQQRRLPQNREILKQHSLPYIKPHFPIRPLAAIQSVQELLDLHFGLDVFFDGATGELQLVPEIWEFGHDCLEWYVRFSRSTMGGADREEVRD